MIGLLLLLQGIIGLFVLLITIGLITAAMNNFSGGQDTAKVPQGAALLINPAGVLVEQAEIGDPFQEAVNEAFGARTQSQIEVHDMVRAIREAKDDDRISGIVLSLGLLNAPSSSASKLHYIGDALESFKTSGKKIIAVGDYYSQEQYMLAAYADEVYLNDYGNIVLYGFGRYTMYYKSFLERLNVTRHVFRVGTFKAAVEPISRDDMSQEVKEANLAYLNVLWDQYLEAVTEARGEKLAGDIRRYADEIGGILRESNGDFAKAALDYGLVDGLKSRAAQRAYLKEVFGPDKEDKGFKNIDYAQYLDAIGHEKDGDAPNVAIVTAAGVIMDGQQPSGVAAGGDTIAKYLKEALEDDEVKAVVLRVDSPGGSAFASEVMRDGVLALKEAGKPVVVSMGSLAASGGYWISAPADEIWAAPTTLTGSIGIFGYFTTFENTAAELGVYTDGVGTSALSSFLATGIGPLPEAGADIIQQSIENGYDRFLNVVSEGRGLETSYVDQVGQGRIWIGETALELKLVDHLGDIDAAIAAAANLAKLEDYDRVEIIDTMSPFERLFSTGAARIMKAAGFSEASARANSSTLRKLIAKAEDQFEFFEQFNDPSGAYARCLTCE